jgi:hypothetical protein
MIIFAGSALLRKNNATARPIPKTASAVSGYSFATPRIPSVPKSLPINSKVLYWLNSLNWLNWFNGVPHQTNKTN